MKKKIGIKDKRKENLEIRMKNKGQMIESGIKVLAEEKGNPNRAGGLTKNKNQVISTHTSGNINWGNITKKITLPNIAKTTTTLGGVYVGSLLGASVATGLGFAIGGPAGAALGYSIGNYGGCISGWIMGSKVGKKVAKVIDGDKKNENDIVDGKTEIDIKKVTIAKEES